MAILFKSKFVKSDFGVLIDRLIEGARNTVYFMITALFTGPANRSDFHRCFFEYKSRPQGKFWQSTHNQKNEKIQQNKNQNGSQSLWERLYSWNLHLDWLSLFISIGVNDVDLSRELKCKWGHIKLLILYDSYYVTHVIWLI